MCLFFRSLWAYPDTNSDTWFGKNILTCILNIYFNINSDRGSDIFSEMYSHNYSNRKFLRQCQTGELKNALTPDGISELARSQRRPSSPSRRLGRGAYLYPGNKCIKCIQMPQNATCHTDHYWSILYKNHCQRVKLMENSWLQHCFEDDMVYHLCKNGLKHGFGKKRYYLRISVKK